MASASSSARCRLPVTHFQFCYRYTRRVAFCFCSGGFPTQLWPAISFESWFTVSRFDHVILYLFPAVYCFVVLRNFKCGFYLRWKRNESVVNNYRGLPLPLRAHESEFGYTYQANVSITDWYKFLGIRAPVVVISLNLLVCFCLRDSLFQVVSVKRGKITVVFLLLLMYVVNPNFENGQSELVVLSTPSV